MNGPNPSHSSSSAYARLTTFAAVCFLGLMCGGCAVTTIDVDVYKGPLVNDPAVQMEQTAAMAVGAKPILIQLRNHLEWPGKSFKEIQAITEYADGFMPSGEGQYKFKYDFAARANAILSLYDDQGDQRLTSLLAEGNSALGAYRSAYELFRNYTASESAEYQLLVESLAPSSKLDPNNACAVGLEALKTGYREFFERTGKYDPSKEYEQWIFKGHVLLSACADHAELKKFNVERSLYTVADSAGKIVPDALKVDPSKEEKLIPSNTAFELLSRPDLVAAQAIILFPDNDGAAAGQREWFVKDVTRIAGQFRLARLDLSRLWHVTLELIDYVQADKTLDPAFRTARIRQLARYSMDLIDAYRLGESFAIEQQSPVQSVGRLWDAVRNRMPAALTLADVIRGDAAATESFAEAVANYVAAYPAEGVEGLRAADILYANCDSKAAAQASLSERDVPPAAREYGLVHGPVIAPKTGEADPLQKITSGWGASIQGIGAIGLDRGRLQQGLNTLTENYLQAVRTATLAPGGAQQVRIQQDQLLAALVEFSEKVLFIANNSVLLGAERSTGDDQSDSEQSERSPRDYARVLQAVGNSILVQVDELRHKEGYDSSDEKLGTQEQRAARAADISSTTQPTTRTALTDGLSYGRTTTQPVVKMSQREVIDEMIAKLRYEYVRVVRDGGSTDPQAQRLLDSIQFLYQQRANMVYIRPPAAFLRDSYPVTSLQQNPGGLWTNELSREAARGMPFVELFRDYAYDTRGYHDAQTQKEIDKQFWQNINRIRVAGTGRTNYVMVKDDIGNWYVKGYSADPSDIIESMRETASFAVGAPLSSASTAAEIAGKKAVDQNGNQVTSFSKQATTAPTAATAAGSGATPTQTSSSGAGGTSSQLQATTQPSFQSHQLASAQTSYQAKLIALDQRMDGLNGTLSKVVLIAWGDQKISADSSLSDALAAADAKLKQAIESANAKPADTLAAAETRVQQKLKALTDYRLTLFSEMFASPKTQPSTMAATQAAASAAEAAQKASQAAADAKTAASSANQAANAATQASQATTQAADSISRAADAANSAASASNNAATAAKLAVAGGPGATTQVAAATQASEQAVSFSKQTGQLTAPATQEAASAKKFADATSKPAGDATSAATQATTQADAATTQAADALKLAAAVTQPADKVQNPAAPAPTKNQSNSQGGSTEVYKTTLAAATRTTTAGTETTQTQVTEHVIQGGTHSGQSRSTRQVPTVQPTQPETASDGTDGDGQTSPTSQKKAAFAAAAAALRSQLQPLIQDAVDATETYQSQLELISGK